MATPNAFFVGPDGFPLKSGVSIGAGGTIQFLVIDPATGQQVVTQSVGGATSLTGLTDYTTGKLPSQEIEIQNRFALPTVVNYDASQNLPAITQGQPLIVNGSQVFAVTCSVASTSSTGPFSTVNVNDILACNATNTWQRFPADPVSKQLFKGDGTGGVITAVPGLDYMVPLTLNVTTPISSRPTGMTVGTNGALTTAPFANVYGPTGGVAGIWVYFYAGDLWSGNTAGLYWVVMTSTTTGTAYQNMYVPGTNNGVNTSSNFSIVPPTAPIPIVGTGSGVLGADNTPRVYVSVPMDGSTGNLPVGYMGATGWAEINILATFPSSTNNKSFYTALNGSTAQNSSNRIGIAVGTSTSSYIALRTRGTIKNRNSQSSQVALAQAISTAAETWTGNQPLSKLTFNTATACFLNFEMISAAEFIVIETMDIRISPN